MYNHNKAQQSKNSVHISWDILYITLWAPLEVYAADDVITQEYQRLIGDELQILFGELNVPIALDEVVNGIKELKQRKGMIR